MNKQEVFKKRVYKELDRINNLYILLNGKDSILTVLFFNKNVAMGASARSIKEKLGLNFNDLKKTRGLPIQRGRIEGAGLSLNSKGWARKAVTRKPKITRRRCNMEDINHEGKETWFNAKDDFYSCPKCTNIKLGEAYSAGMDERNLGYIG